MTKRRLYYEPFFCIMFTHKIVLRAGKSTDMAANKNDFPFCPKVIDKTRGRIYKPVEEYESNIMRYMSVK